MKSARNQISKATANKRGSAMKAVHNDGVTSTRAYDAVLRRGKRLEVAGVTDGKGRHARKDQLLVTCWCEMSVRAVAKTEIRAGRTVSCGREHCGPP